LATSEATAPAEATTSEAALTTSEAAATTSAGLFSPQAVRAITANKEVTNNDFFMRVNTLKYA
jgi:hypothetical protein